VLKIPRYCLDKQWEMLSFGHRKPRHDPGNWSRRRGKVDVLHKVGQRIIQRIDHVPISLVDKERETDDTATHGKSVWIHQQLAYKVLTIN